MRFAPTGRNQGAPKSNGKRKIRLAVAMQVSDLALVEAKLDAPEAMGAYFDAVPVGHDVDDPVFDFLVRHDFDGQNDRCAMVTGRMRVACQITKSPLFFPRRHFDSTIRVATATGEL
jgi:hypothetical protein